MKRNGSNLKLWKETCRAVYKRADGRCEVIVNGKRCGNQLLYEDIGYINFAHKSTRNGKSDEEVLNPKQVVFSCASHHIDEHAGRGKIESVEYDENELNYVPDAN